MITSWLVFSLVTGALLSLAALALERAAAALRLPIRSVWIVAMVATVALPLAALFRPPAPAVISRSEIVEPPTPVLFVPAVVTQMPSQAVSRLGPDWTPRLDRALLTAWLLLSTALLAQLAREAIRMRRKRATWRRATVDGTPVRIAMDSGPAAIGLRSPEVVLPEWSLEFDAPLRALILRHEAEHQAARDPAVVLASKVLSALVPWHLPLLWQARRLRLALEIDCDARVLHAHPDQTRYARLLIAIAQRRSIPGLPAVAILESPSHLERRIRAMRRVPNMFAWPRAIAASVLAVLVIVAACAVREPPARGGAANSVSTTMLQPGHPTSDEIAALRTEIGQIVARLASLDSLIWLQKTEGAQSLSRVQQELQLQQARLEGISVRGAGPSQGPASAHDSRDVSGILSVDVALHETPAVQDTGTYPFGRDRPALWIPGQQLPKYPSNRRGELLVNVQFAIDTTGRVDMTSVRIVSATDSVVAVSVREGLAKYRYIPAELDRTKLRTLVQQEFLFQPGNVTPKGLVQLSPLRGIPMNYAVDVPALAIPGQPQPVYPAALTGTGLGGDVDVQFVVDTLGRPDMRTFMTLKSPRAAFTEAVRAALPRHRYVPAESRGTKVVIWVMQRFSFPPGQ